MCSTKKNTIIALCDVTSPCRVKEITFFDIGLDRRALLNVSTKKYHVRIWARLISLKNGTCGGLLSIR